jgi:hypothetical protein
MGRKMYKRVTCQDGFSMSVQAGEDGYSSPREDGASSYTKVEVGYPSAIEDLLMPYAEDGQKPTLTVYPYVPMEVIEQVIQAHGGMVEGELPPGHRLDLVAPKVSTRRPSMKWLRYYSQ